MIGKKAPNFNCKAVLQGEVKELCLDTLGDCYKVLFFYPQDFTFVCPTELHAFQEKLEEFTKRNVAVIGCSVDDVTTHAKWLETPKEKGGIAGVCYPLLSDESKQMCRAYGVLDEDAGVAFRGLFLLDKNNVVQSMVINNMSLGRNIDEVLRLVDALQFVEAHGQVCPANWQPGQEAMDATTQGVCAFFARSK